MDSSTVQFRTILEPAQCWAESNAIGWLLSKNNLRRRKPLPLGVYNSYSLVRQTPENGGRVVGPPPFLLIFLFFSLFSLFSFLFFSLLPFLSVMLLLCELIIFFFDRILFSFLLNSFPLNSIDFHSLYALGMHLTHG